LQNISEYELSSLTWHCVSTGRLPNIDTLQRENTTWSTYEHSTQLGVDWQMKVDSSLTPSLRVSFATGVFL